MDRRNDDRPLEFKVFGAMDLGAHPAEDDDPDEQSNGAVEAQ